MVRSRVDRCAALAILCAPLGVFAQSEEPSGAGGGVFSYGPSPVRSALHYFRGWSDGSVESRLARDLAPHGSPARGHGEAVMSASQLSMLLHSHQAAACAKPAEVPVLFSVHAAEVDPRGVHHAVLRSDQGHLQYVALRQSQVLFMDPPVCEPRLNLRPDEVMHRRLSEESSEEEASELKHEVHIGRLEDPTGEKEELLHPTEDPLVQDCIQLFKREFAERCSTSLPDIDVLSASLEVVDGFLVRIRASFVGSSDSKETDEKKDDEKEEGEKEVHHRVWCAFEVGYEPTVLAPVASVHAKVPDDEKPPGVAPQQVAGKQELASEIASLKEQLGDKAPEVKPRLLGEAIGLLPEEKEGLHAKVVMHLDICDSAKPEKEEPEMGKLRKLVAGYSFGELSMVKGYRHVYDGFPNWADELQNKAEVNTTENATKAATDNSTSFSLVEAFPMCFPSKDVVRSQGMCGSCWAFASASALMTNICTAGSGNHSISDEGKRYEVSVQRLISCNSKGLGCQGGHGAAARDALLNSNISKERYVPYKCGGGNSLDHFDDTADSDCEEAPWGGSTVTCEADLAEPDWHFGHLAMATNALDMQRVILSGKALYVSFRCFHNVMRPFWKEGDGLYDRTQGDLLGGHAVVALGYGVSSAGRDYWFLQNSWGVKWGEDGFFKFLRGVNLARIEQGSVYFSGWPTGSRPPPVPGIDTKPDSGAGADSRGVYELTPEDLREKLILFSTGMGLLSVACFLRCCFAGCGSSTPQGPYGKGYQEMPRDSF